MDLQNREFDALTALAERWRILQGVAVVDDDYPEQRHKYEIAMRTLVEALVANGRVEHVLNQLRDAYASEHTQLLDARAEIQDLRAELREEKHERQRQKYGDG